MVFNNADGVYDGEDGSFNLEQSEKRTPNAAEVACGSSHEPLTPDTRGKQSIEDGGDTAPTCYLSDVFPIPRNLYVHIPFCERKCPYCAFNSYGGRKVEGMSRYVDALLHELDQLGPLDHVETIYVGGGTPTSLSALDLHRVLHRLRSVTRQDRLIEWTVEANPGTVTPERLQALVDAGVGRVSMGVQSMNPDRLRVLGRIHSADDVRQTVALLRQAGIEAINLDLIYGQPDQRTDAFLQDLDQILALDPDHISLYALQFEEGTAYTRALERGRLEEAPEDVVVETFHGALERVVAAGFDLYEISNFARPGCESRHNQAYWRNAPYYGIGAGAYACVDGHRLLNENDPDTYTERMMTTGDAVCERERLTPSATYVETLASGLRTTVGVDLDELVARTGLDPRDLHARHLERIIDNGLARQDGSRLALTLDGLWLLDSIMEPFLNGLPESAPAA